MQTTARTIIEIEGQRFEIDQREVHKLDVSEVMPSQYEFEYNQKKYSVRLIDFDLNNRRCVIEINGHSREAKIYRELDIMIENMGLNSSQSKKQSSIHAPMPGLVSSIRVVEGDVVTQGAPLIILEAMKMENVISAPHDAVIKKINVTVGQAVERGFAMIELAPSA